MRFCGAARIMGRQDRRAAGRVRGARPRLTGRRRRTRRRRAGRPGQTVPLQQSHNLYRGFTTHSPRSSPS
ncbi:hypothetical protein SFR_1866 [Streptomyces sp. FR-008]|nr:hypothetical protein SFR_1866 [Streptomyces sp. FR-008]